MESQAKILIISQARMSSTRLPGKIFLRCAGRPLLDHHIARLRRAELPLMIATTLNSADAAVETYCKESGISFFRGDENDVLDRYYKAASQAKAEIVVRVTSDCPLIDGEVIRQAVKAYAKLPSQETTYLSNTLDRTYPRGFDFEVFSFALLEKAWKEATQAFEREHVTPFIWKSHPDKFKVIQWKASFDRPELRLTVDEADDFTLIKTLIEKYEAQNLSAEEIIAVMDRHPELIELNRHIEQKKV